MEQFFDEIRPILEKTIIYSNTSRDEEIFKLKNENEQLVAKVSVLQTALQDKERDYVHIKTVLQAKNEEWKGIKERLSQYKNLRAIFNGGDTELRRKSDSHQSLKENDTKSQSHFYNYKTEKQTENDIYASTNNDNFVETTDTDTNTTSPDSLTKMNTATSDDTQLPESLKSKSPAEYKNTNTQLDMLVNLISDSSCDDGESEGKENEIQSHNISRSNSSPKKRLLPPSLEVISNITQRKGHKRGCPCCEKYYQATRTGSGHDGAVGSSSPTSAYNSSFINAPSTPPGFWDVNFTPRNE